MSEERVTVEWTRDEAKALVILPLPLPRWLVAKLRAALDQDGAER